MNNELLHANADDEACERAYAELRIYGDNFDPSSITNRLGIGATSIQKRGDVHTGFAGRKSVAKTSGWFLSSEGIITSCDLSQHLSWLLSRLLPAAEQIRLLQKEQGIQMWVFCIFWSKEGGGGWILKPDLMRGFGELNLECGFELSLYDSNY